MTSKRILLYVLFLPSLFWTMLPVRAELPLTIENLLTAERKWRLDIGIAYVNTDRSNVESRLGLVQTGPGQFLTLPVAVGEARQNSDTLVLTPGLRYGWTLNTEVYGRFSAIADDTRTLDVGGEQSRSTEKISDFWLGVNHRFSDDNDTPALLGFLEVAVGENTATTKNNWIYGKSGVIGITSYRTTDPLVLALTIGYRYSAPRDIESLTIDPGDMIFINPSVGFAVNNEVTLTSGLQWRWRKKEKVAGRNQGLLTTSTDLEFGLGYGWSKRLTLLFNTRSDMTGNNGIQMNFTALYKIPQKINLDKLEGGERL